MTCEHEGRMFLHPCPVCNTNDYWAKAASVLPGMDNPRSPQDLMDAAAKLARLEEEVDDLNRVLSKQSDILRRTANALHGGPLENGYWSHHDLPELVEQLREDLREATARVKSAMIEADHHGRFMRQQADEIQQLRELLSNLVECECGTTEHMDAARAALARKETP